MNIPKVANNLCKTAELHHIFKAKLAIYLLCLHIKKGFKAILTVLELLKIIMIIIKHKKDSCLLIASSAKIYNIRSIANQ